MSTTSSQLFRIRNEVRLLLAFPRRVGFERLPGRQPDRHRSQSGRHPALYERGFRNHRDFAAFVWELG